MKVTDKNIYRIILGVLMTICFATMVFAWWVNGCKPGGNGDVNGIAIVVMIASMVICAIEEDWMTNENNH